MKKLLYIKDNKNVLVYYVRKCTNKSDFLDSDLIFYVDSSR